MSSIRLSAVPFVTIVWYLKPDVTHNQEELMMLFERGCQRFAVLALSRYVFCCGFHGGFFRLANDSDSLVSVKV